MNIFTVFPPLIVLLSHFTTSAGTFWSCVLFPLCFTTRGGKIWPPDISIPSAAGTLSSRLLSGTAFAASHFKSFKQKCSQSAASYVFRRKTLIVVHGSENHQHSFVLRPQEVAACFRARSDTATSQTVCGPGGSENMSVGWCCAIGNIWEQLGLAAPRPHLFMLVVEVMATPPPPTPISVVTFGGNKTCSKWSRPV